MMGLHFHFRRAALLGLLFCSCAKVLFGAPASTEEHWAFLAPKRAAEPSVRNDPWVRNSVDAFILEAMRREGLTPAAETDRVTLIRRASLDLIGLPPTPEEVDAFLADQGSGAYERLIDRLLASPHFGERWGRHWLDAARYADTNGYEKDLPRSIWPYRDWVIGAFNRNLPFDQFVVEQLAGDLLPDSTLDQRVATGFLRNSMINEEGGVDPEQFRVEGIIDRIDALGKALLGLSVNCAQCHDHKYDPISQREYYQLFAFLNNDDEPEMEVPNEEQSAKRAELLRQIGELEAERMNRDPELAGRMASWEKAMKGKVGKWETLDPVEFYGAVGTKFTELPDHSLLATASSPPVSGYTISVKTTLTHITGFRLEVLRDPNLPDYGPGRAKNGNFVLTEFSVEASPESDRSKTNLAVWEKATADFEQKGFPAAAAIDGALTNKLGWAVDGGPLRRNADRKIVFAAKAPLGEPGGTVVTFQLKQLFGGQHTIGRLRLSATTDPEPVADPLSAELRAILEMPESERTSEQQRKLFSAFRGSDPTLEDLHKQCEALLDRWPVAAKTLVLAKRDMPRSTSIFRRGDFRQPQEPVTAATPAVLHPWEGVSKDRLQFARWISSEKNPLLARVIMNRMWQSMFGVGLVATPEDFGRQGARPTHPELLDWLAREFMDGGWRFKEMARLIACSGTYRQSSNMTPEKLAKDPTNRWLSRTPRMRVEGEIIRDIALAASGLLSRKIGGASVYPPIPDGVLSLGYGAPMAWPTSTGSERYRRAMYTFWKRSAPYPSLLVFDAPTADFACVRRVQSDTPLQALTTLNDAVFHEAAQGLGLRLLREGKSDLDRVILGFRLCTGRAPDAFEIERLIRFYEEQYSYFEERTAAAVRVCSSDPAQPPPEGNLHKAAAWTMVGRVLLNLDETITKE